MGTVVGHGVRIAEGTEEAADIALGTVKLEGHGNFIVGIAVAVGILFLECGQNLFKILQRHRFLQSQPLQPGHVDHDVGRDGSVFSFIDVRGGIDVAVRRGAHFPDIRSAFEQGFHVRCVLLNQVIQGQQHALGSIVDQVGRAQGQVLPHLSWLEYELLSSQFDSHRKRSQFHLAHQRRLSHFLR